MFDLLLYILIFALLALAVLAGYWVLKTQGLAQSPMGALFGPRAEKRLAVVDHASVDGRRRLVLIRRDGVEHLIMTGGPVDVVIETGIGPDKSITETDLAPPSDRDATGDKPVFGRQRTLIRPAQQIAE